jgi:16S rRNA (uracil1498-N3)-methyltransferase
MARRRFFVEEIHHQRAELNGDDARHLTRVLRVERGQKFEISDNRAVYLAEVSEAHKERVVFTVVEKLPFAPRVVELTLLLALIKFERFEWALEKGTEAGVARFVPVVAERSEKGLDRAAPRRMTRWRRIVLEASQQARRDKLPVVAPALPFGEAVATTASRRYLLDEKPGAPPILQALPDAVSRMPEDSVAVLIGPEGGWTAFEHEEALNEGWAPVSLGPQILRTETAAVSVASIVFNAWWAARK